MSILHENTNNLHPWAMALYGDNINNNNNNNNKKKKNSLLASLQL